MTTATQSSSQPHKNYIAGAWAEGAKIADDINPSDTKDVVGQYAYGDAGQANAAVMAAKDAFPAWSRARMNLADCSRARKGNRLPKASGRWCGLAKFFCSFPVNACASPGTKSRRC